MVFKLRENPCNPCHNKFSHAKAPSTQRFLNYFDINYFDINFVSKTVWKGSIGGKIAEFSAKKGALTSNPWPCQSLVISDRNEAALNAILFSFK